VHHTAQVQKLCFKQLQQQQYRTRRNYSAVLVHSVCVYVLYMCVYALYYLVLLVVVQHLSEALRIDEELSKIKGCIITMLLMQLLYHCVQHFYSLLCCIFLLL
jgi:hypothetical protein